MKLLTGPRPAERTLLRIPLKSIRASPFQPRQTFPAQAIADLAESIRLHGQLTPLLVRRVDADAFELIAGERRLRALRQLGRTHADAIVLTAYDRDSALLALVENLQREELHYLDEAEAFRQILDGQGLTQEALARSLSLSASALANRLRLLKLPEDVRGLLRETGLSERHARALLRANRPEVQRELVRDCAAGRWSVRQLESRIQRILADESAAKPQISRIVRDNRLLINAVLDSVRQLKRIGVQADSRIEEHEDRVDVIVSIRTPPCADSRSSRSLPDDSPGTLPSDSPGNDPC